MNKAELIERLSLESGMTKKACGEYLDYLTEAMSEALSGGEKVQLVGFGVFEVKERKERAGYNPASGENIQIPATKTVTFKPGKALKDRIL